MKLSEARKLKVGDRLYHHSVYNTVAIVEEGVFEVWSDGKLPKWTLKVKENGRPWIIDGRYAFNWSTTPTKANP